MIDTAAFQRLRRLEQTSYRVLYPSASHDRFTHSLGVFHLGKLAYEAIVENQKESDFELMDEMESKLKELKNPFLTACLLHDVGHAPFSHTCEDFFDDDKKTLRDKLIDIVRKRFVKEPQRFKDFEKDVKNRNFVAKPHEFMGAILLIDDMSLDVANFFNNNEEHLDFAARAIIGCTYDVTGKNGSVRDDLDLKNALIRILNSTLIDVDKLDYTVRDSITSGYSNVEMDLPRLMSSYTLAKNDKYNGRIWPAYKKSALSVIEHVFLARNNQIRWIQSHNAVVYETELLQRSLMQIEKNVRGFKLNELFCFESLREKGTNIRTPKRPIHLLADEDILSLMKKYYNDVNISETEEYFNRGLRKRAIWKTHAEYNATFNGQVDEVYSAFARFLKLKQDAKFTRPVNKANFDSFFDLDENYLKDAYMEFFSKINYTLDDSNSELLFVSYNADKFSKKFNAEEIFLVYNGNCKSFYEVMKSASTSNDKNVEGISESRLPGKGFFVFYKRINDAKISPNKFLDAYNQCFSKERAKAPA
ncbi:MAG: HD domain-containing protein [Chitinispirillales bacterium]|nr:HD domain-containing protein [Chitinispirillales bacterium]